MINISKISVFIAGRDLFKDVSFTIRPKDRIGLTGKNGAGKSTILKIISGVQQPTTGSIDITVGKTIGYLPQEMNFSYDQSVFGETMAVFKEVLDLENHNVQRMLFVLNQGCSPFTSWYKGVFKTQVSVFIMRSSICWQALFTSLA